MITAAARRSPAVQEPDIGRMFLPNTTAADCSVSSQSLMTLAGVASLQLPFSEAATRAPVVVAQVAGDASTMCTCARPRSTTSSAETHGRR